MDDALPFDPTRTPDLDAPGPRKPLSKFQYASLFLSQEGRCFKCREKLENGKVIDEHLVPRETLPADRCDDLENRKLFCRSCAKAKTVEDQAVIAKSRRVRGERGSQRAKREKNGSQLKSRNTLSAQRVLLSPSENRETRKKDGAACFGGGLKKHPTLKRGFDGKVVLRSTRKPSVRGSSI